MAQTRTCPHGHDWDGDPADCPDCFDESLKQNVGSTFRDELPPPPRSVRIAPQPKPETQHVEPANTRPVIPGYEVLDELGRGGMGTVYRARHLALNRLVALKVISAGTASDPRELERFAAEAEAIAQLQHPGIVQVYEVGQVSGRPYLALELVAGGTLASSLGGTPLPARTAAEVIESLAQAVAYAHSRGVVHRDLKPGNILLAPNELGRGSVVIDGSPVRPKVTDFGLAKRIDVDSKQTTTGVVVGTPSYMSPEQATGLGKFIGPACDIYALGAILYELLTGRPPFHSASPVETLQQVVAVDPVSPSRLQPHLPRDLETICLCCLRKESRKRYATAGALADDVRRYLDGRPIQARRTPLLERAAKWARRRPAAAALAMVCVLAAIALTIIGIRHNRMLERHNEELAKSAIDLAAQRDEKQRQAVLAELNLEAANDAIEQMLKRVGIDRLAAVPYMDRVRAELLEDAIKFYDKLLAAQAGDPRLRLQRAHTLELAARVHFALGRFAIAIDRYNEAQTIVDELRADADNNVKKATLLHLQGLIINNRSLVLTAKGDQQAAQSDQKTALALRQQLLELDPTNPQYQYNVAASNLNLAIIAREDRRFEDQALYLGRARAIAESLTRDHADDDRNWYLLGLITNDLGTYQLSDNDLELALQTFESAVKIWRKLSAYDRSSLEYRAELARSLTNISLVLQGQGYIRRAGTPLQEALQIREQMAREHPDIWRAQLDLASSQTQQSDLLRIQGDYEAALQKSGLAIDRLEANRSRLRDEPRSRTMLCEAYTCRARALGAIRKYGDMAEAYRRAIELADSHRRIDLRVLLAQGLIADGKPDVAIKETEEVLREKDLEPANLVRAAGVYGLAAAAIEKSATKEREQLLARAVSLLHQADEQGYFRRERHRQEVKEAFKDFRGRPDFEALLAKFAKY